MSPTDLPGIPHILVVDDEPIVRGAVMRILGGWGFRILEAETAEEAMAVLTTLAGDRPQLVIIDIVLPGDNGVELARQIRDEFPDQRILFMSAHPKDVLWAEGLRDGTEAFVPKPFTAEALIQAIEEVLRTPREREAKRPA
jgi:two-component system, cell cycle sensor histidine kinase and response regulator CckA